ncbi:DUF4962 domain-containing protein [Paenibacillus sp. HWE-109]|uniref:DUF4962 domain-containing protein n=1 Tax=Paenibacillus sp. HWE-109 TaxID=1306526 RepID=UPI001EDCC790|nr:DUF4962 domain-containing protein [Paenibacillus sp. HWE-109]UKS27397.1 DUF4962 domain-containing protein [Paenibacillus sp. HWE-109]
MMSIRLQKRTAVGIIFLLILGLFGPWSTAGTPIAQAASSWPPAVLSGLHMPFGPADSLVTSQNPPDFKWPAVSGADKYDLQVSRSATVSEVVYENQTLTVNFYNFPHVLDDGTWYWRVRYHTAAGGWSVWSDIRKFRIEEHNVPFVVPPIEELMGRISTQHPRIFTTPDKLAEFRSLSQTTGKAFYDAKLASLTNVVPAPPTFPYELSHPRDEEWANATTTLRSYSDNVVNQMMDAAFVYLVSGSAAAGQNAKDRLLSIASWDPNGATSYEIQTQVHRYIALCSAMAYDWMYDLLTPVERTKIKSMIQVRTQTLVNDLVVTHSIANNPYDPHGWTGIGFIGIIATAMLNDIPEAEQWFKDVVPAYINILPPWGGEDGGWGQGTGYWQWSSFFNKQFMDVLLAASGMNLYAKAYSRNEGMYPLYTFPNGSPKGNFGDDSEQVPGSSSVTVYNRLAQMYGDPHLKWAAQAIGTKPTADLNNYFYGTDTLTPRPPMDLPDAKWFQDVGQVAMHSELYDPARISFYFKSSPYGSFSHSHANQNGFVLNAYGESLAIDSGFYDSYFSDHDAKYAKQTFASNAITMDRKQGQPIDDLNADGRILGFVTSPDFDATSGDASAAYMGKLAKDDRHVIYIRPDAFVVIDQLQSNDPSGNEFEWRLHAEDELDIDADQAGATIMKRDAGLKVRMLAPANLHAATEDKFLDQYGIEQKPKGSFANEEQKHAAFIAPRTTATTFVATLNPFKRGTTPPNVVSENHGNYMKLTYEDGSVVYVRLTMSGEIDAGTIRFNGAAVATKGDTVLLVNGTKVMKNGITLIESSQPSTIVYGNDGLSVSGLQETEVAVQAPGLTRLRESSSGEDIPRGGAVADGMADRGVYWEFAGSTLTLRVEKGQRAFKLNNTPMPHPLNAATLETLIGGVSDTVTLQVYSDTEDVPVAWGKINNPAGLYEVEAAPAGFIFEKHGRPNSLYLEQNAAIINRGVGGLLKLKRVGDGGAAETLVWEDPDAKRSALSMQWQEAENFVASGGKTFSKYTTRAFLSGGVGIGDWDQPGQWVTWKFDVPQAGNYDLFLKYVAGWNLPAGQQTARFAMIGSQPYYFEAPTTQDYGTQSQYWRGLRLKTGQPLPAGPIEITMWNAAGAMNLDYVGIIQVKDDEYVPTAPGNLESAAQTETTAALSWSASTDNAAIKAYNVYVDGKQKLVIPSGTLSATITGLEAGHTYSLTVKAVDTSDNLSVASAALSVTTNDSAAPEWGAAAAIRAPQLFTQTARLEWDQATDNSGKIAAYTIYQKQAGQAAFAQIGTFNEQHNDVSGLQPGETYTFMVKAKDPKGNESATGPTTTVTMPATLTNNSYYETFDNWTNANVSSPTGNWSFYKEHGTTIEIVPLPGSSSKALKMLDNWYDSANEYGESTAIGRDNTPLNGKVTFETKFMFSKVDDYNYGNAEMYLSGGGKDAVRFTIFSDGTIGYRKKVNNADVNVKIPMEKFLIPKDQWITLRFDLDTASKTYVIKMQTQALINEGGLAFSGLDPSTGVYQSGAIPFFESNFTGTALNKFSIRQYRYKSSFLFDYITMYERTEPVLLAPGNVQLVSQTDVSATVSWSPATGNTAVTEYQIYADGTQKATVPANTLSATLDGLEVGHTYAVTVKAIGGNGSLSATSSPLTVLMNDTTPPIWSGAASLRPVQLFPKTARLEWDQATDNSGTVTAYSLYQLNGSPATAVKLATVSSNTYDVQGLQPGATYTFKVEAADAKGNESLHGPTLTVTLPTASSHGEYYETFDDMATGNLGNSGSWSTNTSPGSTVTIEPLPSGGKALKLVDNTYSSTNEYVEMPMAKRGNLPLGGTVTFETKFMFSPLHHTGGNLDLLLRSASSDAVRFTLFSDSSLGYYRMVNGNNTAFRIPKSGFTLPSNQWVTLRFDLDMTAKTYAVAMQSDAFKSYTGTVDAPGTLDRSTGIYRITAIPFYNNNIAITEIDAVRISAYRFTGNYWFDDLTMYNTEALLPASAPMSIK